jgi:4-amino-4-deoxy-L-arabinose transferase-like glycosyltransferase
VATYTPSITAHTVTEQPLAGEGNEPQQWREAVLITIAATLIRLFMGILLAPYPDETYYWEWSRHLAGGYFDHPPLIAWLIAAGGRLASVFGGEASGLSIRFFPVLAGGAAAFFSSLIVFRLGGGGRARRVAMIFAVMPLAASGLILATPDAPLLATTAATLYFVVRALQSPARSFDALKWWSIAGVMLGLAFSSKYTSILLPVTLFIAMLSRPGLRARLAEPGPYIAAVLATLVFLPVLQWNAAHDWVSFRFQLGHGLGPPSGSFWKRELDLVGGQFLLVSPALFAYAVFKVAGTFRKPQSDIHWMLAVVAAGTFAFFMYSATRRSVEANWPAPAYVPAMILVALMMPRHDDWLRRGMGLAGLMSVLIYTQAIAPIFPIPARKDPVARSAGWLNFSTRVQNAAARTAGAGDTFIGSDRYQDVSELAFNLTNRPTTICTCVSGRRNQYDLWPGFPAQAKAGDNLVLAIDDTSARPNAPTLLQPHFSSVTRGELIPVMRGKDTVTMRRIWRLAGYRGGWPSRAP